MTAIYKKELRTYFTTLSGYIFLSAFIFVTALYFSMQNVFSGYAEYNYTLASCLSMFFIIIPVLTMRLFSEETKQKTDQLLFTSPVTVWGIVLAKFFAAFTVFLIGVAITMLFPFIISLNGEIDVPVTIASVAGYILVAAALIAIGVFISALTENQIAAFLGSFISIFVALIMNTITEFVPTTTISAAIFIFILVVGLAVIVYTSTKSVGATLVVLVLGAAVVFVLYLIDPIIYDGVIVKVLNWFSVLEHYEGFYSGVWSIADVIYYITFAAAFLFLTVNAIEKKRWS